MFCQHCLSRNALEREGRPIEVNLFGEIVGHFCAECIITLQEPYNHELRAAIASRAPGLTEADLGAMPDQMLKFTLCLPIPRQPS